MRGVWPLLLVLALQDPGARCLWERDGTSWACTVDAAVDLPDGARLKARVFVVDPSTGQEEPLDIDFRSAVWTTVRKGRVRGVCARSGRRPFSLQYRVRLSFERSRQPDEVAEAVDAEFREYAVDAAAPDADRLPGELTEAAREIAADLRRVDALVVRGARDDGELRALRARNDARWAVWAAWVERQGKGRLAALYDMLDGFLAEPSAGAQSALHKGIEETCAVLGLEAPVRREEARRLLTEYVAAVARRDEAAAVEKLLALADARVITRRGYARIQELAVRHGARGSDEGHEALQRAVDDLRVYIDTH